MSIQNFQANGILFPESSRPDINSLIGRIPKEGTLHIAILQPPYLALIADGTKTIESRFNTKRAAPFGRVAVGDLVLLKETGRPITHYFFAATIGLFDLSETPVEYLRDEFGDGIQAQDEDAFWHERESSRYATLIEVGEHGDVEPFEVMKKDQRGWVTFERRKQ